MYVDVTYAGSSEVSTPGAAPVRPGSVLWGKRWREARDDLITASELFNSWTGKKSGEIISCLTAVCGNARACLTLGVSAAQRAESQRGSVAEAERADCNHCQSCSVCVYLCVQQERKLRKARCGQFDMRDFVGSTHQIRFVNVPNEANRRYCLAEAVDTGMCQQWIGTVETDGERTQQSSGRSRISPLQRSEWNLKW